MEEYKCSKIQALFISLKFLYLIVGHPWLPFSGPLPASDVLRWECWIRRVSVFGRVFEMWKLFEACHKAHSCRGGWEGRFFFCCCSASPPPWAYQRHAQKGPDTELQLRHITHPRKAFRGHLTQGKLSCWDPQRDGGELIFLFFRSQMKGGLGGKGVVLLSSRSYYRLLFFMAVTLEVGGGQSPTFLVWCLFLTGG